MHVRAGRPIQGAGRCGIAVKGYILKRLFQGILVVFLVVTLVFFLMNMTGDPVQMMLGPDATEQEIAIVKKEMGLDQPLMVRYGIFLKNIIRGDFGDSISWKGRSALSVVLERFPATVQLNAVAFIWSTVLALVLGVVAAQNKGNPADRAISTLSLFGQVAPSFWVGLLLILLFAVRLKWLPPTGYGGWEYLVMPAFVMGLNPLAGNTRFVRSCMLETMSQDYITTARAKGLRRFTVLFRHCLRNVAIPLITSMGQQLPTLIGGSAILETVFAWPGIGRLLVQSIGMRDYPVVQCTVCFSAAAFVLINLLIDLMYGVLDPRVKLVQNS